MVRDRLLSARPRYFNDQFVYHCEPLEARRLLSGGALADFSAASSTAEWGVAAIRAPDVWTAGYTGRGVTVAVVDTGIALAHPDLAGRLWTNADEVPGNGRDDDGNGFVDDVHGWDFLDADSRPDDPAGHGTHIAGIIAAGIVPPEESENAINVGSAGAEEALGVAPDASVMPIRVLDGNLRGANRDIAAGIRYAVDNGADVINLSIGGAENSAIRSALEYAGEHDVLVVAAAGNDRAGTPSHPAVASSSLDNVLSAAAFRESGEREPSSNLVGTSGAVQVDAPGQAIRSTFVTAKYGYQSGTSMAAPHVAGLAALLLSANSHLSAAELRSIIVDSVDPPAAGSDSAGRVNAVEALALALQAGSRAADHPAPPQAVAIAHSAPATPLEQPSEISVTAAKPPTPAPVIIASQRGVLILPPAIRPPAEMPSAATPSNQVEPIRQSKATTAASETERSLRDAALLAYRVETGGSAMSWPLKDTDESPDPQDHQARKTASKSSASEVVAARVRPRPADAAPQKTANQ